MTNPVLAKSEAFSASYSSVHNPQSTYGQSPYMQQGYSPTLPPQVDAYGNPIPPYAAQGAYAPQPGFVPQGQYPPQDPYAQYPQQTWAAPQPQPPQDTNQRVMTLDDVLTKSAITLGLVIVVAALTMWSVLALNMSVALVMGAGLICGIATIIFPFIAAARRKVGPGIALTFAVLEGAFIGAFSLIFELYYPGIVVEAVVATFVTSALIFVAFKFGKFRLSSKFRKIVVMCVIAFAGVALVNLVLSLFGVSLGLFPAPGQPVTWIAWLAAGIGVVLAVLSLVDDFQFIEQGIKNRLPASESWRAAYGLTVTLVWLYSNILRILSYIRN